MNFAKNLKIARTNKYLSQAQIGKMLCVSQDTISNWESGKAVPKIDIFVDLLKILDLSPDELLGI